MIKTFAYVVGSVSTDAVVVRRVRCWSLGADVDVSEARAQASRFRGLGWLANIVPGGYV